MNEKVIVSYSLMLMASELAGKAGIVDRPWEHILVLHVNVTFYLTSYCYFLNLLLQHGFKF